MPTIDIPSKLHYIDVTVPNGQQLSTAACLRGMLLLYILIPSTFTSTSIGAQICQTLAGTYSALQYGSGALAYTATAGGAIMVSPENIMADYIKITTGSAEGGNRTITLIAKDME